MVRKTMFYIITVIAVWVARGVWDYNPELRGRIGEHPWQSLGLLVLGAASVSLLVWAQTHPNRWNLLLGFGLGVATALWGSSLLKGIGWTQVGIFAGCVAMLIALWAATVVDSDNRLVVRARERLAAATPPAP